jgi:YHS domain-containing protein
MKKSGANKITKKPTKKKTKLQEWIINILAIVFLGAGFVVIAYMSTRVGSGHVKDEDQYLASLPPQKDTIAHNKVCMVDDIYQGDYPTLPVALFNTAYYGCDAKAIQYLVNKEELRVAVDPVTKRKVDKASAVIGLHPKRDGKVLYFESKETFTQYLHSPLRETSKETYHEEH